MKRMNIYFTKCKRCGKPLASLSHSIWGVSDDLKKHYEICENCITEEEKQELQNIISSAVLQTIKGGKNERNK